MKPVMQLVIDDPRKGDCFAACVASILEMRLDQVPNFCLAPDNCWWDQFQSWLDGYGMCALEVNITVVDGSAKIPIAWMTPGVFCILSGKSPRGDWLHSVVAITEGKDKFVFIHDPHPDGGYLDGPARYATFFAALDPRRVRQMLPEAIYEGAA